MKPKQNISNFSPNSKLLTSQENLSLRAEMIKSMNIRDGSFFLDRDSNALSKNLGVVNIGQNRTSHFALADSMEKRDDESPIKMQTNNVERNSLENLIEELSPIGKGSQSRFPLLKQSLPPFSPIRSEENSHQGRPRTLYKLHPDFLSSRMKTDETQLMSPSHSRQSSTHIGGEGYPNLPLIEHNASQTSKVQRSERVAESLLQHKRFERIFPLDHDQPSGSRLPAAVDFSGRIARMKQELASMRQACS